MNRLEHMIVAFGLMVMTTGVAMAGPLANGDFEASSEEVSGWTVTGNNVAIFTTIPQAGEPANRLVRIGESTTGGISRIYQEFNIPAGATTLTLKYHVSSYLHGGAADGGDADGNPSGAAAYDWIPGTITPVRPTPTHRPGEGMQPSDDPGLAILYNINTPLAAAFPIDSASAFLIDPTTYQRVVETESCDPVFTEAFLWVNAAATSSPVYCSTSTQVDDPAQAGGLRLVTLSVDNLTEDQLVRIEFGLADGDDGRTTYLYVDDVVVNGGCAPVEHNFTADGDFSSGYFHNVQTVGTGTDAELTLTSDIRAFESLWVSATGRGTVIRIDTANPVQVNPNGPDEYPVLGEYHAGPEPLHGTGTTGECLMGPKPMRSTVDLYGSAWVALWGVPHNRGDVEGRPLKPDNCTPAPFNGDLGAVTRIGTVIGGVRSVEETVRGQPIQYIEDWEYTTCRDRDGDGRIRTSAGLGNQLPWADADHYDENNGRVSTAEDECITETESLLRSGC